MSDPSQAIGSAAIFHESIALETAGREPESSNCKQPSFTAQSLDSNKPEDPEKDGTLPSPTTPPHQTEQWNNPQRNIYKSLSCFWSFIILGMSDATPGAILPYLQSDYNLRYTIVSIIFLTPVLGCVLPIFLNNTIHLHFGPRGLAFIGATGHIIAYITLALHPPYPVLLIAYAVAGFANGLQDAGWNAWRANLENVNEIMGFLHAFYGAGALVSPAIATAMIVKAGLSCNYWYFCMLGFSCLELGASLYAFWSETAERFRETHVQTYDHDGSSSQLKEAVLKMPAARTTWLCTLFLLGAMGVEISIGGWIVEFMLRVRKASSFASGMSATGFWLGMTLGRVVLGFVTARVGENRSIMIYLPITAALELLFWLVPQFYVSAIAVALQGFFIGPLFPSAVVAATKILPKHLHVSSLGFATAIGEVGGSVFPYAIGAIAQVEGVKVLQPIVLALLVVIWLLWLALVRVSKKG